jgi:hypothetical protein
MSLDLIMTQIAVLEATVPGVLKAHDKAPATMNVFPCFVNFPVPGAKIVREPSVRRVNHNIIMELHCTNQVKPESEAKCRPYLEAVLDVFDAALSLNGSCYNSEITGYNFGVLNYNGQMHLGYTFELTAQEVYGTNFAA